MNKSYIKSVLRYYDMAHLGRTTFITSTLFSKTIFYKKEIPLCHDRIVAELN